MKNNKFDIDTKELKGHSCKTCLGTGRTYCCGSLAFAFNEIETEKKELEWNSIAPFFPGTRMEMTFCPFCGRRLDRVGTKSE